MRCLGGLSCSGRIMPPTNNASGKPSRGPNSVDRAALATAQLARRYLCLADLPNFDLWRHVGHTVDAQFISVPRSTV
jgi:hypothetical protein